MQTEYHFVTPSIHQPLAYLNGSFSGAQLHWSVIEKEAFPIMEAIDGLRHSLIAEKPSV